MHSFLLLAIASISLPLSLGARVSTNARCGSDFGLTCKGSKFGNCCSQHSYCGSTSAYCGEGCQEGWGNCNAASLSKSPVLPSQSSSAAVQKPSNKVTTDARCGKAGNGQTCLGSRWGDCCSQYSYCGSSPLYCGAQCQTGFGKCDTSAASSVVVSLVATSSAVMSLSSSTGFATSIVSSSVASFESSGSLSSMSGTTSSAVATSSYIMSSSSSALTYSSSSSSAVVSSTQSTISPSSAVSPGVSSSSVLSSVPIPSTQPSSSSSIATFSEVSSVPSLSLSSSAASSASSSSGPSSVNFVSSVASSSAASAASVSTSLIDSSTSTQIQPTTTASLSVSSLISPSSSSASAAPSLPCNFATNGQFTGSMTPWTTSMNQLVSNVGIVQGSGHNDDSYYQWTSNRGSIATTLSSLRQITKVPLGTAVECSMWVKSTAKAGQKVSFSIKVNAKPCGSLDLVGPSDWTLIKGGPVITSLVNVAIDIKGQHTQYDGEPVLAFDDFTLNKVGDVCLPTVL